MKFLGSLRSRSAQVTVSAATVAALLLAARPLAAHTKLTASSPAAGATLATPPAELRLTFSERLQLAFTEVRLLDAAGVSQALAPLAADPADSLSIRAAVRATLAAGIYRVQWQTAGRDGHPIRGSFSFTVAAPQHPVTAAAEVRRVDSSFADTASVHSVHERVHASDPAEPGEATLEYRAARWTEFVALLGLVGAIVFRLAVLPRLGGPVSMQHDGADAARQVGLGALVLLGAAWVARLVAELTALTAGMTGDLQLDQLFATPWGEAWTPGLIALPVAFAAMMVARRWRAGWHLAALAAVFLAATPGRTGHAAAATQRTGLSMFSDVWHVVASGAWLGTLLVVVIAGIPALLRARRLATASQGAPDAAGDVPTIAGLIRAFHPVGLVSAAAVVATGLVSAWLRVGTVAALFGTSYGRLLLLKLAFVAVVLAMGGLHWRGIRTGGPAMAEGDEEPAAHRFRRTATIELLVGAAVLAVTAVLVVTSPP